MPRSKSSLPNVPRPKLSKSDVDFSSSWFFNDMCKMALGEREALLVQYVTLAIHEDKLLLVRWSFENNPPNIIP